MTFARVTALSLSALLIAACTTYDSSLLVDGPADGASGAGGSAGNASGGAAGKAGGGAGTTSGGAGNAGDGGASGDGGTSAGGTAGGGASGAAGAGGAGAGGGAAGTGGAGGISGGSAGQSGSAGAAAGMGGAGAAGKAGAGAGGAGSGGAGGAGSGGAGAGGAGSGGAGAGGAGGKACTSPSDCDDANACTTDSCDSLMACAHAPLVDDTPTPGVSPDLTDCKASVCKAGKVAIVPAATESGDDSNLCTTDSCSAAGVPQHTPLTGVIACDAGDATKVCVAGVCKANSCGDGVLAGAEECDGSNLNGQTCAGLGYASGGSLACAAGTCKFATLGCISVGDLFITEVLYDANTAEPESEWIEIYNASAKAIDLRGLKVSRGPDSHVIATSVVVQPSGYVVVGSSTSTSANGGAPVVYGWGSDIALSNTGPQTLTLAVGAVVIDTMPYTGSGTYSGKSYSLKSTLLTATANDMSSNFCAGKTSYGPGGLGTPGSANDCP